MHTAASRRNRVPLMLALRDFFLADPQRAQALQQSGFAVDLSAGTGAQLEVLAPTFAHWQWLPTEYADGPLGRDALQMLDASGTAVHGNVLPAHWVDLSQPLGAWGAAFEPLVQQVRLAVCVNVLHIAPWPVTTGLFDGANALLRDDGVLAVYGPFKEGEAFRSPGDQRFDAQLRAQGLGLGIRDLEAVLAEAEARGLTLAQRLEMPANNLLLLFGRSQA